MMMDNGMITNNYEYGDGYMEQEEEWEREGLLDPAWEKQQKKVSLKQRIDTSSDKPISNRKRDIPHKIILSP